MLTRRQLLVSASAFAAAGCAGPRQPMFTVRSTVEAHSLKDGTGVELLGIEAPHAPPEDGVLNNTFYLWSLVRFRDRVARHEIEVVHHYLGAEIAWNGAQDRDGKPLPFKPAVRRTTSCTVTRCSFIEIFSVVIAESVLRAEQDDGFSVIFSSRAGQWKRINVSPTQIKAQLAACDAVKL